MAIEPNAVTIHDSSEIAPTLAMFVGSMMMPEPIMFTATMNVSCIRLIFFAAFAAVPFATPVSGRVRLLPDGVSVEFDAPIDPLLVDTLHFVVEPGEPIERLLKRHEVVEHRLRALVPPLTRNHDSDSWRVDQRERRSDATLHRVQRHVVHLVGDQCLVCILRRHRELRETRIPEALPL